MLLAVVVKFLSAHRPSKLWSDWREHRKAKEKAIEEAYLFYLARFDPHTLTELFG